MLLAEQVYPFLLHEDYGIREHALEYFAKGHDRSPMTADDVWAVVDRYGWQESVRHLEHLALLPTTPRSIERLIAALRRLGDRTAQFHLATAAGWLPLETARLLLADPSAKGRLRVDVVQHIEARLALADTPFEKLWNARKYHNVALENARTLDESDQRVPERLVEALARFPEQAAPRALEILSDAKLIGSWQASLAVRLFGRVRHPDALDPLLRVVADDEGDFDNERAVDALVHLGTAEVVDAVTERYAEGTESFRLYAPGVIGRIRQPASESALLWLLEGEEDLTIRTSLAMELCDLCATEGLLAIWSMVSSGAYDMFCVDLDDLLLTVGTMQGYKPPDAGAWKQRIAAREARAERRRDLMARDLAKAAARQAALAKLRQPRPRRAFREETPKQGRAPQ